MKLNEYIDYSIAFLALIYIIIDGIQYIYYNFPVCELCLCIRYDEPLKKEERMKQKKINISELQDDWSHFINQIMQGDEVILTKVDKPIAIISPVKDVPSSKNLTSKKTNYSHQEEVTEQSSTNSEWWLG